MWEIPLLNVWLFKSVVYLKLHLAIKKLFGFLLMYLNAISEEPQKYGAGNKDERCPTGSSQSALP